MAKRRGKGKAKAKVRLPPNPTAEREPVSLSNEEPPPALMRKQKSVKESCTETKLDGELALGKAPSVKQKRSNNTADNEHKEVPLKRSRLGSAKPSMSTQEVGNAISDSNSAPERGSLTRNDTLIIEPSTSGATAGSFKMAALSMRSSIAGPSASAQSFTTPKELIRIASLKKGLSRHEITSILPAAASLSDKALSSITQPSTSDPETRALIAESMELMRCASLRKSRSHEASGVEPNAEEETQTKIKERKLPMRKDNSQSRIAESLSEGTSGSVSESVKYSGFGPKVSDDSDKEHTDLVPTSTDNDMVDEDRIDGDVQTVSEVHPYCDPVYIREQLLLAADDPHRVSTVTFDLISATDIPTRANREIIHAREMRTKELQNMTFAMETFSECYPQPELFFETDRARIRSKGYVDHVHVFLKNEFRSMVATYMYKVLRKHRNYLTPTYIQLKEEYDAWLEKGRGWTARQRQKYLLTERTGDNKFPDEPNEEFYYERLYINHRQEILAQIMSVKKEREERLEQAKREGKVRECEICCTEDMIIDDMLSCQGGHFFCKECIKMAANEQMGQGRSTISCLESGCPETFQFFRLEHVLPPQQSALLLSRMQAAEVQQAEIEGLASCPFCPYAVIMSREYPMTVVFCQRPGCRKITCLICKDVDHMPMTCEEYKVSKAKRFKAFIENSLSDAIIRECGNCHMRFFKEDGCNYMTCSSCGAHMCYVCREMIPGYIHFHGNAECQQFVNTDLFHKAEIVEAYNHLEERFRQANPGMYGMGDMEIPDIYRPEIEPPGPINR